MAERFTELERMKADEVSDLGRRLASEPEFRYVKFLFYADSINDRLLVLREEVISTTKIGVVFGVLTLAVLALILWRVW